MKLKVVVLAAAAALGLSWLPATAQSETKFEVGVGGHYALLSQEMFMDQGPGYRIRAGMRIAPKWTLLGLYESTTSDSTVPNQDAVGDVTLTLYGLNGIYTIRGERQLEIFAIGGLGYGSCDWDNPSEPVPGLADDTNVFWIEAGAGANVGLGQRFTLRLQLTARQYRPSDASAVLPDARLAFVPSADVIFRF
jgi:opacity protein-like surface antigen